MRKKSLENLIRIAYHRITFNDNYNGSVDLWISEHKECVFNGKTSLSRTLHFLKTYNKSYVERILKRVGFDPKIFIKS